MTKEEIRTNQGSASLFYGARSILSGAVDLLHHYIESSKVQDNGENMFKVHSIIEESLKRFNQYEEQIYG